MGKFLFNNNVIYRSSRHVSFFLLTLLLFSMVVFFRSGKTDFAQAFFTTLLNAFFFFAYGYITIFVLVPYFLFKRFFLSFILIFLLTGISLSFLKFIFSGYLFASFISPGSVSEFPIGNWRQLIINTKDMSFIVAVFAVAKYTKDWLYAERQRTKVESRNAEARLKLLQSQFDPHFLFNTLNNLYALSLQNNDQTVEIIKKLKIVLRYLLIDVQGSDIVLNEEIKLIKNYIDIEQIRYGNRLATDLKIQTDDCLSHIAPMLFFPIIENCFKHGSSIDAGSPWIKLDFSCNNERLIFNARNSIPRQTYSVSKTEKGNGLQNLTKRLDLLYPGKYDFKITKQKDEYSAKLEIKLK